LKIWQLATLNTKIQRFVVEPILETNEELILKRTKAKNLLRVKKIGRGVDPAPLLHEQEQPFALRLSET
jgi:hypothetical protein